MDPNNPLFRILNPGMPAGGGMGGIGGLFNRGPSWMPQGAQMGQQARPGLRGLLSDPNLGLALLANSGPSAQPRSFGQIFGQSALQAKQMQQESEDADFKRKYMEAQMGAMQAKDQSPSSVKEYEYAVKNGYKGTFQDWTTVSGQTSRPSSVQEWEFYNALPKDKQQLYLEMKRNPNFKVAEIGGGVNVITGTPGGGINRTQLSTLPQEAAAAQTLANAKGEGAAIGEAQGAQAAKAPAKSSMNYVLSKMREVVPRTQQGGLFGVAGRLGTLTDKQDKERFNNLREQLSTELRTVFRIPGEGTLSDREQQQYGIQLPDTNNEEATNLQILDDIEARVGLRTETPIGNRPAPASPSSPTRKKRYNPATGKIE